MQMKTFTVALSRDLPQAASIGFPCATLVLRLQDGRLIPTARRMPNGGLLGLYTDGPASLPADLRPLCREICSYILHYHLSGVLLDLSEDAEGMAAAAALCPLLSSMGIPLYLPISLAEADPKAKLILPSAISGGSFSGMLDHFLSRFPADRLCLELVRTRHDFPIPSPDPEGTRLSAEQFEHLRANAGKSWFSADLCAHYFTYMHTDGNPHLVLYDDVESARHKLDLARKAGLSAAFALYCEWGSAIRDIFCP